MTSIDSWEEKYGDNEKWSKPSKVGFDYELNVAYKVRVSQAKVIKSKRDEICLMLDLDILEHGEPVGKSREWFTLPKQVTDAKMAVDLVRKLTFRRRDDLQRMLSVQAPSYAKYARREYNDGKPTYYDFDDNVMSSDQLREAERTVNTRVMELSDQLHDMVDQAYEFLTDAEFYIVKAPNKRNPDYPYTNIFNNRPDTIPVFGEEE